MKRRRQCSSYSPCSLKVCWQLRQDTTSRSYLKKQPFTVTVQYIRTPKPANCHNSVIISSTLTSQLVAFCYLLRRRWTELITTPTRLPSNLRPTIRECVHVITRGHFRSRDKDGGRTIQSAISENPMLQANFMALFYRTGVIAYGSFTLRV